MGGRRRDQGEILADLRTGQTLSVAAASSRSSSPGSASPADVIDERLSRLPKTTPAYARRLQIVCRLRGGPQGRMGFAPAAGGSGTRTTFWPVPRTLRTRWPAGPADLRGRRRGHQRPWRGTLPGMASSAKSFRLADWRSAVIAERPAQSCARYPRPPGSRRRPAHGGSCGRRSATTGVHWGIMASGSF
jgi:hypothetical protein